MSEQDKIKEAMELKNKRINRAIDRKEKSISFWASMNNAVNYGKDKPLEEVFKIRREIENEWRSWYMDNVAEPEIEYEKEEQPF